MKKLVLMILSLYQAVLSPAIKNLLGDSRVCRFTPTCSAYAKEQITKKGVVQGTWLSLVRISKCQPFFGKVSI